MEQVSDAWATWVDVSDYESSDSEAGASVSRCGSCSSDSSHRQLIRSVAFSGRDQLATSIARRLPKQSSQEMVRKLSAGSVECSICKDKEHEEGVVTDCLHGFHNTCLSGWIEACLRKGTLPCCPNCRAPIPIQ